METWMFYALLSVVFAGLQNFIYKVASVRGYNSSLLSEYSHIVSIFLALIYFVFYGIEWDGFMLIAYFALFNVLFYFFSFLTRMESLKCVDSVIFFPLYKTLSPIFVTGVSIIFFQESLNTKEIIGIICGIFVPLLLITSHENKIQKNLYRGLVFIVLTSLFATISSSFIKGFMIQDLNVGLYLFISFIIGYIFSYISRKISYRYNSKQVNSTKNGIIKLSVILGIFHFISFLVFTLALVGNLAIVFTINSFSILIPIILSIIFYGEHFNLKKAIVIALSIVSILMFL